MLGVRNTCSARSVSSRVQPSFFHRRTNKLSLRNVECVAVVPLAYCSVVSSKLQPVPRSASRRIWLKPPFFHVVLSQVLALNPGGGVVGVTGWGGLSGMASDTG